MRVYGRGNNGTREGFYMKTSPVTLLFIVLKYYYCEETSEKNKTILSKEICTLCKLLFFQVYKKSTSYIFFKLLSISLFRCQKLWFTKKNGFTGLIF